ncbi:MAG: L-threonylcarbamoyladenylate synthase [Candidatus Paceibacterota bacterium]
MTILYPTETLYALGVNAFDPEALATLYKIKGREEGKAVSVLVQWKILSGGRCRQKRSFWRLRFCRPLTLVLRARDEVPRPLLAKDGTLGFRVSLDKTAQAIIKDFIDKNQAPLTCTSANLSGLPTLATPKKILEQLGNKANLIDKIYDDGPRAEVGSTVIRVIDDELNILRDGAVSKEEIYSVLNVFSDEQA